MKSWSLTQWTHSVILMTWRRTGTYSCEKHGLTAAVTAAMGISISQEGREAHTHFNLGRQAVGFLHLFSMRWSKPKPGGVAGVVAARREARWQWTLVKVTRIV